MTIDLDNFRHLTGLGRRHAEIVDRILDEWPFENSPSETGNIQIWQNTLTGEFEGQFIPNPDGDESRIETVGEHTASSQLMLSIILSNQGKRNELISLPLALIVQPGDFCTGYQLYQHDFVRYGEGGSRSDPMRIETLTYIGITKRGWRTRWGEHVRAAGNGSHYRFHKAIREFYGTHNVVSSHTVVASGLSERAALSLEETLIERDTLYPLGLNMVPGGNAGLAYLRKIDALGERERVAPDDRQNIINRFFDRAARKGLPNPLAAANWLNPNYAEQVICGGPDRLKPQQIRDARFLSSLGKDAAEIMTAVGARNVDQVQRLLSGSTYSRIL